MFQEIHCNGIILRVQVIDKNNINLYNFMSKKWNTVSVKNIPKEVINLLKSLNII